MEERNENAAAAAENEDANCCICGRKLDRGHSHNPAPLFTGEGLRCCDECNAYVIKARDVLAALRRWAVEDSRKARA